MTLHTWKTGASGAITDSTNYADGTPLVQGDTILVHDGTASALTGGAFPAITIDFAVTGPRAEFDIQSLTLGSNDSLNLTGPNPFSLHATGANTNQGSISVAVGTAELRLLGLSTQPAGSFANSGMVEVGSSGTLTINPLSGSSLSGGNFLNTGVVQVDAGGTLNYAATAGTGLSNDGTFTNNGKIAVAGGGSAGARATLQIGGFFQGGAGNVLSIDGGAGATAANTGATFADPVTGANISVANGNVTLLAAATNTTVTFVNNNAYLFLDSTNLAANAAGFGRAGNVVAGFQKGDALLVSGNADHLTYDTTSHVLSAVQANGAPAATFFMQGSYHVSDFLLIGNNAVLPFGNFAIVDQVACFVSGTRIATPRGERAVETLSAGDHVLTASGESRPVRWVGHRAIDCAAHRAPETVRPVRVRRASFGPAWPHRDLLLSPEHCVFFDEMFIPIRCLINGMNVVQERVPTVTYYHIELDAHDVVLAEGMPAESYLDTGNRRGFVNGGGVVALKSSLSSPAVSAWEAHGRGELVVTGPRVDAVRRHLKARAEAAGFETARAAA